ncbi:autophagy-related protein 22-like protein [Collybia nuda]|uniref:Autophagy-related protein n=1 Tax=Collybia nuda TaxID=64659 RepID=A0A9P5Y3A9_9AGAR|nr:autophagy-related protein 22-like protein [Collybia nuda]
MVSSNSVSHSSSHESGSVPSDSADPVKPDSAKELQTSLPQNRKKRLNFVSSINKDEPIVTRRELWSYYMYYNGDNSVGPIVFSTTLFQSLVNAAGFDPIKGPGSSCSAADSSGQCVLPWGSGTKAVASVILLANGVSFAMMTLIFTTIGSAADYGTFGRWLLFCVTCVCWGAQFASISLTSPSRWPVAMAIYMISFISYGATLVFFAAAFPRLARNTAKARKLQEKLAAGEIDQATYDRDESMEKNRISSISTTHSNIGFVVTFCLTLAILIPLADNPKVDNYTIVLVNGYWVVTGIWWFVFQLPRPGPKVPDGENYLTIGWKQIWQAIKHYKQLPYTFVYLFGFFCLADGLNTTVALVAICQNDKFSFSFLQTTYLGLAQAITSTMSTLGFWYVQRHYKIPTKKMFVVTNVVTVLIPLWGMVGIWTQKFGFHNVWEFWSAPARAYNIVFGLFQAPYYSYSQTMMAELTPPGFDNMFFGLFGLSNRASSMIGPNVIQAIIDRSGSNWMGFPFLFALCSCASLIIWFGIDVTKGRQDALAWAEAVRVQSKDSNDIKEK